MLRELYELSTHFPDLPPLGYNSSVVTWQIDLSFETAIVSLLETQKGKGKPKPGKKCLVPDIRRNGAESLLIDDAAEYVFGIGSRGPKRHPLYLDLLQQCIHETQDQGAIKVLNYIQSCDLEELDRQISNLIPPPTDKKGNPKPREQFWWERDRVMFVRNGEVITHRPAIKQFWATYYSSKQGTVKATCLLTGEMIPTISHKMPAMVKGVPNTQSSGAALTSFDKAAYESYGWQGNTNAPIGFDPAVQLHQALDMLLTEQRYHTKLGNQAFIFWGDRNAEGLNPQLWNDPDAFDDSDDCDDDDPDATTAKSLFESPNHPNEAPDVFDASSARFYLAILKGNKGRIALSGWDERTPEQIKTSVQRFIHCQKLTEEERVKPIWVLRNCAFLDPRKEYTDRIDIALVRGALFGEPLPEEYALKVLNRISAEQDTMRNLDRAKALSFYLETTMDESHKSGNSDRFAYTLGRVAFLMHWAQVTAQNLKREETNVSRSLRALSTTPEQIFPRLYQGCITNHLEDRDALNDKKRGGILINLKKRLEKEFLQLGDYNPETDLPHKPLSVRQQAQFFLGFAKCRAEYFNPKNTDQSTDEEE
ncbi:MAG: type I-C CRISPR-associated protein Cas8c/Csd1 [Chroococcales cyanobacterium]